MNRRLRIRSTERSPQNHVSGFTLLEVILALGLTGLLLVAIYGALEMHWMYSRVGQVEMERSQVARALFNRIEIDVRSVVFQRTPQTSGSSTSGSSTSSTSGSTSTSGSSSTSAGGTNSGSSTGGSQTSGSTSNSGSSSSSGSNTTGTGTNSSGTTSTDSTSTGAVQKSGMWGDSQSLIVHVSLPRRTSNGLAASSASSSNVTTTMPTDLQSVGYFIVGSSSSLAQQLSSSVSTTLTSAGQTGGGLARLQGDRMAMTQADDSGSLASLASNVKLLAPEVASIQFEYYDGVIWADTWDTATSTSVPNAVRVTIEFQPPSTPRGGWFARPINASTNRYQSVIALPLAEPYVDSSSL